PGGDGALALSMIHVLLDEGLYDADFVREWTNGALLVREDSGLLLTERDLSGAGPADTYFVWDQTSVGPVRYHAGRGYARDAVTPALEGSYPIALADGEIVSCRPAFALLTELAARYAPERSEHLTWVPAADVRRAVRLFVAEQPSCYYSWVGIEEQTNTMQTNRAVCLFYASRASSIGAGATCSSPPRLAT